MNRSNENERDEDSLFVCDISDEALETAGSERGGAENITWYHCPTGLTLCRF
jgi:hypothetical protein